VEDGATVGCMKVVLPNGARRKEKPKIDRIFEATETGKLSAEKLKSKWAAWKYVGADKRIGLIARDILTHFDATGRMDGKAMIISTIYICVDLYNAIIALRPECPMKIS
jgi:type I site-specific restriction-modification system R (restriction) subunit